MLAAAVIFAAWSCWSDTRLGDCQDAKDLSRAAERDLETAVAFSVDADRMNAVAETKQIS